MLKVSMFTFFKTSMLFAESTRAREVMQAFRGGKPADAAHHAWWGLIITAACLALTVAIVVLMQRSWKRRMSSTPQGLFLDLCRAHRLKWSERRLLGRLAQSQKLADSACLFLRPECFEIGRLTVDLRPHLEELRELGERLFAPSREEKQSAANGTAEKSRPGEQSTPALALPPLPPTLDLPQWTAPPQAGVWE
jgi:hypothetical protein